MSRRVATVAVGAMLIVPQSAGVAMAVETTPELEPAGCDNTNLPDGVVASGDWYVIDWDGFTADSHDGGLEMTWTEGGKTTVVPNDAGTKLYLRNGTGTPHTDVRVDYEFNDHTTRAADVSFVDGCLGGLTWSAGSSLPDGVSRGGDWYMINWDGFTADSHDGGLEITWTEGGKTSDVPNDAGTILYLRYNTGTPHTDVRVDYEFNDGTLRTAEVGFDAGRVTSLRWSAGTVTEPDPVNPTPVNPDPVDPDPVDSDPVEPTPPAPVDHGPPNFGDVAGNTHAAAIDLLYRYGITTGTSDTSYNPSGDLSRGQMGSFLVRLLALTDSDIARPDSHDAAMQLLVERGIFHGQANGELESTGTLTRGQAASVLVRLIEQTTGELIIDDAQLFTDGGATHGENIAKLATLGVVNGYDDGTFRPHVELQRDQMASLVARTIQQLIESGKITDLDA